MRPLAILATGMVTGVGLNAPATCAACRAAISNFTETRFMDEGGEFLIACQVPLEDPWRDKTKLLRMIGQAIRECLASVPETKPDRIPVIICLAEEKRAGRLEELDSHFSREVESLLGVRFHPSSAVISRGHIGGVLAIQLAEKLIHGDGCPMCLIAATDSYVVAETLADFQDKSRLLTSENSDGFIPGEAGSAILVGPGRKGAGYEFQVLGIGFGKEEATINSEEPSRADGLVEALRNAFTDSGKSFADLHYRITDMNGEQYPFKEATLAMARSLRPLKERFEHWHPANFIGEVGSAITPCVLGLAWTAARKGFAPGTGVLCHFGNDDGERAALILRHAPPGGS